ncbi:MAG: hypothetical protein J6A74_05330 [Oscillospiraceae bacterium]|nr:hypothetical protein [Oscillospiraceae bacterium]
MITGLAMVGRGLIEKYTFMAWPRGFDSVQALRFLEYFVYCKIRKGKKWSERSGQGKEGYFEICPKKIMPAAQFWEVTDPLLGTR